MSSLIKQLMNQAQEQTITKINHGELELYIIKHNTCEAIVSSHGAQLLHWQPKHTNKPVIWLSDTTFFKKDKAIRGGVPICWPWFGDVNKPSHGFARISEWQLEQNNESETEVQLLFTLTDQTIDSQYQPQPFSVQIKFMLGETCEITLTTKAGFEVTSALHSYFHISDIHQITVKGLGKTYLEKLTTFNPPKTEGEMTFDQEVDRIYQESDKEQQIIDNDRIITLTQFNHSDVVTWNPWEVSAEKMADLSDYHHFVCVETARIKHPIQSKYDEAVSYGVKISVTDK